MPSYLGQHFLKDKSAIRRIIAALELHAGDTVIEIGAGRGALTFPLVEQCRKIGAEFMTIEKDRELAVELFKKDSALQIKEGDALEILPELFKSKQLKAKSYKVVGNIPYYITGKLLRTISELENKPELTVLMIQKEVAERVSAQPPHMNLLAAATQIWADSQILFTLPPKDFDPPPKVDSAVIQLTTIKNPNYQFPIANYYQLIHIIFKQPRKTLLNNLREGLDIPEGEIKTILASLNLDPQSRPQNLSMEQLDSFSTNFFLKYNLLSNGSLQKTPRSII